MQRTPLLFQGEYNTCGSEVGNVERSIPILGPPAAARVGPLDMQNTPPLFQGANCMPGSDVGSVEKSSCPLGTTANASHVPASAGLTTTTKPFGKVLGVAAMIRTRSPLLICFSSSESRETSLSTIIVLLDDAPPETHTFCDSHRCGQLSHSGAGKYEPQEVMCGLWA